MAVSQITDFKKYQDDHTVDIDLENGLRYAGNIKNSKANGNGALFIENLGVYEGKFTDNFFDGQGVFTFFKTGEKLTANFSKNEIKGFYQIQNTSENSNFFYAKVVLKESFLHEIEVNFSSSSIYKGFIKDNNYEGTGKFSWGPDNFYEGHWKQNKMNGEGTLKLKGKFIYKGRFKDNLFHGIGRIEFPDGDSYDGEWMNGKYSGVGIYHSFGKYYILEHSENELISCVPL